MAYLWHNSNDKNWIPTELTGSAILSNGKIKSVDHPDSLTPLPAVLLYAHRFDTQPTCWILLAAPGSQVGINGEKLDTGIRILADRDAISVVPHRAMYFTTERQAQIEKFTGTEQTFCPRCKLEIKPHDLAVCCPRCLIFHHHKDQDGESCWTYTETCALCDQPTELNSTAFNWSPEDL